MAAERRDNRPPPTFPCTGACRGDRGALEGPARLGRDQTGGKLVWCTCCNRALRPATSVEQPVRPANLSPEVIADHLLFKDDFCLYDTVVLRNIRSE